MCGISQEATVPLQEWQEARTQPKALRSHSWDGGRFLHLLVYLTLLFFFLEGVGMQNIAGSMTLHNLQGHTSSKMTEIEVKTCSGSFPSYLFSIFSQDLLFFISI